MVASSDLLINVEVLSSLQLCNVDIMWPEEVTDSDVQVSTTKSQVLLSLQNGTIVALNCPKSVQLKSGAQMCTVVNNRRLNIRVALDTKACLLQSICSDLASDIRSLSLRTPYDVLEKCEVIASCCSCSTPVTQTLKFDRIRQMPASDWAHASEEWFCCAHGTENEALKSESVAPRQNDCFFSDLFFLVKQQVLSGHVRYDCEDNAVCGGCENVLGVKVASDVKLWTHRVRWVKASDPTSVVYYQCEQDLMVTLIDHLSADSFGANSRIAFVKNSKPKTYLYLGVIDTNLTLLTSANDKKLLLNSTPEQSAGDCISQGKRGRSDDGTKRSRSCTLRDKDVQVHLTKQNVIKVSYKIVTGECDETERWGDDVNVHILNCAESFFDAALEGITESGVGPQPAIASGELFGYIKR
ncbi:uncharacterized protein LOC108679519 [Hyalella azteca]|uniref:E3 ubiquitin-protein ligase E3D n=1 Tax=Hyalella azteca TaxID=294128 RepID=A0A8B7PC22_HYAAZ|nr:uncharacterized protein LOC108679519 [Hyalella azteca]